MAGGALFAIDARGVATITLDRPERLNAITLEMRDLLWEYVTAVRDVGSAAVAVVFRGKGSSFCAGADVSEFGTAPSLMAARRARRDRDLWWELLRLGVPTVAAMHGYCYGAGLELPLCCDIRIAAEGTLVALPEVKLGYTPSAGGTQTLPRIVPPGVAARMVLTGEPLGCDDALRWGIVDRVVAATELDAAVELAVREAIAAPDRAMARRRTLAGETT